MHLLQRDANETFTQISWAVDRNFAAEYRPVLSRVLAVPELRQRYMAHYRRLRADFSWAYFEPRFLAQRDLIDAAVQADPKKLYSYQLFRDNYYDNSVNMPYPGLAGGQVVGLRVFFLLRTLVLDDHDEMVAAGPVIERDRGHPRFGARADALATRSHHRGRPRQRPRGHRRRNALSPGAQRRLPARADARRRCVR
jgi:hypothetical protein